MTTHARAYAAWATVCVVWGTTYLGIRVALETIPPFLMAAFRLIPAGSLMLVALAARGDPLPRVSVWPVLFVEGTLMLGFGNGAVVWAEQTVPSGLTAVFVATLPFWMLGVEMAGGVRGVLSVKRVAGLVLGFAGIVMLVAPQAPIGNRGAFIVGVIATQVGSLSWAIGSLSSKRRGTVENPFTTAAMQMLSGGIVLLALGSVTGEWGSVGFSGRSLTAVVYLVLFGSIAGYTAYIYAVRYLPLTTVSLYAYVNPVIAVILGTVVLGEPFNMRMLAAAAIVLTGTWMVRR